MLRLEPKPRVRFPQEHLADADPVPVIAAREQGLEVVAAAPGRGPVLDVGRQALEDADGHVPVREAEVLEQEAAGGADADLVAAPALEAVVHEARDVGEALRGRLVEVLPRGDFFEEPGFDEGAAGEHDGRDARGGEVLVVRGMGVAVAVADEVDFFFPPSTPSGCCWLGALVRCSDGVGQLVSFLVEAFD